MTTQQQTETKEPTTQVSDEFTSNMEGWSDGDRDFFTDASFDDAPAPEEAEAALEPFRDEPAEASAPPAGQQTDAGQPQPAAPPAAAQEAAPPAQDAGTWQPEAIPEHMKPEDAYGFGKYHQSRADRVLSENQALREQMQQYEAIAPVAQAIMADPQLLSVISQHLNGQPAVNPAAPAQAPAQASQASPRVSEQPTPPEKPANFDPYSDEGMAYLDARERYLSDLHAWQSQQLEQRLSAIEQETQTRRRREERTTAERQLADQLIYEHQFTRQQAEQFMKDVQNPSFQNDLGMWVAAWKSRQVPDQASLERQRRADEVRRSASRQYPASAAAQQSHQAPPARQGDELFAGQPASGYVDPVWGS